MQYNIIEAAPLTEQQEEHILAGYAAFMSPDDIYEDFAAAFPEAMNKFFEEYSNSYTERVEQAIAELSPAHPKFDKGRLEPTFASLRRNYLNNQEEEFLGQSRNRLNVANQTYQRLLAHIAEAPPDQVPQYEKLIIEVLKEARTESTAFATVPVPGRNEISPEELARIISLLDEQQLEEFTRAKLDGEDPYIALQRIQDAANLNSAQKALPPSQDNRQAEAEIASQTQVPSVIPDESDAEPSGTEPSGSPELIERAPDGDINSS